MTSVLVPIKPFGVAKARLGSAVQPEARARLGKAIASHTMEVVEAVTGEVSVLTADEGVRAWASERGWRVVSEPGDGGLNLAAAHAIEQIPGPWLILHADLPLLDPSEVEALLSAAAVGPAIAPSHDGGTSALSCDSTVRFSYGPGSFHAHLRQLGRRAQVLVRLGFQLDLDDADDLEAVRHHARGAWIERYLGSGR